MTAIAYIALGSNLGDRQGNLDRAIEAIAGTDGMTVTRRSSVYETAPVGGPAGQGAYLNAVVEVRTALPPEELMRQLLAIEQQMGRVRTVKDGPRTIDLDLLLLGDQVRASDPLTLPHPRLHERLFVLEPLAEIAPGVVHPGLGQTVAELRARLVGVSLPRRELRGLRGLVTGSTSGIGRAIALELAASGADVIIHGQRSRQSALEVSDLARHRGGRSEVLLADLSDPA